jgi:hypothetical protein
MARPFTNLSDSFKILRDNLNTVSYNIGDPASLTTYGDSDVVQAINEIENVFDASSGEILYPTGATGETQTRLLISTNQNSGTNIQLDAGTDIQLDAGNDVKVSTNNDFFVDATNDIILDAGGSSDIYFKNDSSTRIQWSLDATPSMEITGDFDINATSHCKINAEDEIFLDTNFGTIKMQKNGADAISYSLAASGQTMTSTGSLSVYSTGNVLLDATGDITLDADGADIFFKDGGTTRFQYSLGDTNTVAVTGDYTLDVSGDIILDADGDDVIFKNGSAEYGKLTNNAGNLEIYGGGVASANLGFTLSDNNISVSNPLSLDSSLGTSSQTVAGSLNEIHTELDSAVGEIETVKDTVETNVVNIANLGTRVGQLYNLDSATAGGFFDSAGTNGNVIKALNELARRAVLIYDESGTLLN